MTKVVMKKNGDVIGPDGYKIGTYRRIYNGLTDRGVKLGNWTGKTNEGITSMEFHQKRDLARWFARQSRP